MKIALLPLPASRTPADYGVALGFRSLLKSADLIVVAVLARNRSKSVVLQSFLAFQSIFRFQLYETIIIVVLKELKGYPNNGSLNKHPL